MKFQIAIFIICVCSTISLAESKDTCVIPQCFDCTQCEFDCNNVEEECDSECVLKARKFVCQLEKDNCKLVSGCNVAPKSIKIYPAANYDISYPQWAPQTVVMRPNCCYNLNNPAWQPWYDNTLSGLKIGKTCVMLFDGYDCTGTSLQVDSTWTEAQLKWIDDASRTGPPKNGIKYNDVASSMRLC